MKPLRIGTRDSQLAVWQATTVQDLLQKAGVASELVYMKSEGDVDTVTPLYALGVTGVFTKTLDAALLNNRIDIAVHSMKDVPTQLAQGIQQTAVLKRASYKDIFVYKHNADFLNDFSSEGTIATGSVRRIAQWLNRYPNHKIENLRGNVNTRLRKVQDNDWNGAVFAAAGLERIHLRPEKSIDLDWMLPAPAQGAIMVVCRDDDDYAFESCQSFTDEATALCVKIERDFLSALMGGCSTPISALADIKESEVFLRGNVVSPDGKAKAEVEKKIALAEASKLGIVAAKEILLHGGQAIVDRIRSKGLTADGEA
ncbi:hydroxymethylbilane synthase [Flavisolibacter ginsenosidimutans]|uniref:Hydroxymethylbilane synthase n=1 Tax=Flavisolibacter ginsenosidimutans TaxID=661481 RepID=A0A5B8UMF8_9BACT|nr:hydroxymethylbilane synthase [Flavisolibacter ginsenosidimutans]QEC57743.1 hydroxymethylbilane synthase [Flavisolibacter ginsenosidimutans]